MNRGLPVVMLKPWKPSNSVAVVNASVFEPLTVNGRTVLTSGPIPRTVPLVVS